MKHLFLTLSLVATSSVLYKCGQNYDDIEKQVQYFPRVESESSLSTETASQIETMLYGNGNNARIKKTHDFTQAVAAIYEGYENFEFIYIPKLDKSNEYDVFVTKHGKLSKIKFSIENNQNSFIIHTNAGFINVELNDNHIEDVKIEERGVTLESLAVNARATSEDTDCNPAGSFLDCTDAVINQARDTFGDVGGLAFDIGCSLWVVCRGAFVTVCVTYAVADCVD